jgi:hypothetical protein
MELVALEWDKTYGAGWDMFELSPHNIISEVIEDVEKVGSPQLDNSPFIPSHTWKIIDHDTGVEASEEGISYFPLTKYFSDPSCTIVSCRPSGVTDDTIFQMLAVADKLVSEHLRYDYEGLIGDAIEGVLHLDELIPALYRVADPLHTDHKLFCSALVSTINKATPQYARAELFAQYTLSKISPLLLIQEFPYDQKYLVKKAIV